MKERRRPGASKILLYLGLVFVLVVLGGLIWFSAWVTGYLHSEAFRQLAAGKTGNALHARVNFGPFQWTRDSVFVDHLDSEGEGNSPVVSLDANELRASLNWRSLLGGVWRIDRIDMLQLNASFLPSTASKRPSPPSAPLPPAPSGIAALLPQKFEIDEIAVGNANVKFSFFSEEEFLSATNVRLLARSDSGGWAFSGEGGALTVPLAGKLGITDYRARLQGDALFITESHFSVGNSGKVSLAGQVGSGTKFNLAWNQLDVAHFVSSEWKSRLSGSFSGSSILQPAEDGGWKVSGQFKLSEGQLQNLPLLDRLATFSGSPEFAHLSIDEISGKCEWSQSTLVVTGFLLESKGLLRVESDRVVFGEGKISGSIRVGVGSQALRWLPGTTDRVFTAERDGYLWTKVKLDGSSADPHEDLSERLTASKKDAATQKGDVLLKAAEAIPEPSTQNSDSLTPASNTTPESLRRN